ncbi:hypothetical protein O3M35_008136 [Rhynocoris fuscipes]|uniref:Serine/threonine-protein phosphatase CPPED1 n=1 Tax=Rhynocoris fuscipes TaxID=488301 RepID=A0AAW1DAI6_9HEMI
METKLRINEYKTFSKEEEKKWTGPFYFVQGADTQFGLIARYIEHLKEPQWEKEKVLSRICVEKINKLSPKPKFFVICGDLCDALPDTDWEVRQKQIKDFYEIFQGIDKSIPLVCVCGNHDVGDQPTVESVSRYRSSFGDDYFSFWAGGVFFIVINTQYYYDGSKVPEITAEQEKWLDEQLKFSSQSKHGAVIFQHIPWFLEDPETTTESYFFIKKETRIPMLEKLYKNGVRYVFCGHYHRNSGGFYKDLESIVTTAIGGQIGNDVSGFRIVKVLDEKISHEYYGFDDCPTVVNV